MDQLGVPDHEVEPLEAKTPLPPSNPAESDPDQPSSNKDWQLDPDKVTQVQALVRKFLATQKYAKQQESTHSDSEEKRSPFVPSSNRLIEEFIEFSNLSSDDILVDLGSGDGRVLCMSAPHCRKCIGIEESEELCERTRQNILKLDRNYAEKIQVMQLSFFPESAEDQDKMFNVLGSCTVVWIYLLPEVLVKLLPTLEKYVRPGTKVISSTFQLKGMTPKRTLTSSTSEFFKLYLYEF